jgi:hypothetical protein
VRNEGICVAGKINIYVPVMFESLEMTISGTEITVQCVVGKCKLLVYIIDYKLSTQPVCNNIFK